MGEAKMKRRNATTTPIILFLLLFGSSCGAAGEELVFEENDDLVVNCTADTAEEFEAILWEKDGDVIDANFTSAYPDLLVSELRIENLTGADAGDYECLTGNSVVREVYLSVLSNDSLLIPLEEDELLVLVPAGGKRVIPCRPTHPEVQLTLLGQTGDLVDLEESRITFDSKVGFTIEEGKLIHHNGIVTCRAEYGDSVQEEKFHLVFTFAPPVFGLATPEITTGSKRWWLEEEARLSCSVAVDLSAADRTSLFWRHPVYEIPGQGTDQKAFGDGERISVVTKVTKKSNKRVRIKATLSIASVKHEDEGRYTCEAHLGRYSMVTPDVGGGGGPEQVKFTERDVEVTDDAGIHLDLGAFLTNVTVKEGKKWVRWVVGLETPFMPNVRWVGPDGREINNNLNKYALERNYPEKMKNRNKIQGRNENIICYIYDVAVEDMGHYYLQITEVEDDTNIVHAKIDMNLFVKAAPRVAFGEEVQKGLLSSGENHSFYCYAVSYPINDTKVEMKFRQCEGGDFAECDGSPLRLTHTQPHVPPERAAFTSVSTVVLGAPFGWSHGVLTCTACKRDDCAVANTTFLLGDQPEPVYITEEHQDDHGSRSYTCGVSKLFFTSLTWYRRDKGASTFHRLGQEPEDEGIVEEDATTELSLRTTLHFHNYTNDFDGVYQCRGEEKSDLDEILEAVGMEPFPFAKTVEVKGDPLAAPHFPPFSGSTPNATEIYVDSAKNATISCNVEGNPPPVITWSKDGLTLDEAERRQSGEKFRLARHWHISDGGRTLTIVNLEDERLEGVYSCSAENKLGEVGLHATVMLKDAGDTTLALALGIGLTVVLIILAGAIVGVKYYHKKWRQTKAKLSPKDVEAMKRGDPNGLAALSEAAREPLLDNLYAERAQMLPYDEKVEFPFEKLELGTLLGSGEYGRVLKARARGILGGHNFSTVAVKTLKENPELEKLNALMSELKILIYIGNHPNLVNLLGACTGRLSDMELFVILEFCRHGNLLQYLRRNRRTFSSGTIVRSRSIGSRYSRIPGSALSPGPLEPAKDSVFFKRNSSSNSGDSGRSITSPATTPSSPSEATSSVIFSNYGFDEEPLTLGDLLTWAIDTARGMEYLAAKSIIHMDLACRNILVSEDGRAKITDFGLSKNMYGNLNVYKKQTNTPLPLKWMAPESISDLTFSTYSDVWSYGVAVWEMFSLGRVPYPSVDGGRPQQDLLQRLLRGERMNCPEFAPPDVYSVMLDCWRMEPTDRISFQRIVLILEELQRAATAAGGTALTPSSGVPNFEYMSMSVPPPPPPRREDSLKVSSLPQPEAGADGYLISLKHVDTPVEDPDGYLISINSGGGVQPLQ